MKPDIVEPLAQIIRQQAIDSATTKQFGSIRIAMPFSGRIVIFLTCTILFSIFSILFMGQHTRTTTVSGILLPTEGMVKISTTTPGIFSKILVKENEKINKGTPLFTISDAQHIENGNTRELINQQLLNRSTILEENETISQSQLQGKVRSAKLRSNSLNNRLARASDELVISTNLVKVNEARLLQKRELYDIGLVPLAEIHEYEQSALAATLESTKIKSKIASLEQEYIEHQELADRLELEHLVELQKIRESKLSISSEIIENENRSRQMITAPRSGIIESINFEPGQYVGANTVLATITPENPKLQAVLYLSPKQAGFIKLGAKVKIKYAAYPYQKFGTGHGIVDQIFKTPYLTTELHAHHTANLLNGELYFRVTVTLESQNIQANRELIPLKSGLAIEADIAQETRKLYQWLLDPIYSANP